MVHRPGVEEDLVVWISHKASDRCAGCSGEVHSGILIVVRPVEGVRCLKCEGLGDLVFPASGDAALTRRATKLSTRRAVVVKFSRARKRAERQGTLVEEAALRAAEEQCRRDEAAREARAAKRRAKEAVLDAAYVDRFRARVLELFPGCPPGEAEAIARHACAKYSGRVGRAAFAKDLDPEAIGLAVRAHVRHAHTDYDERRDRGAPKWEARDETRLRVAELLRRWQGRP